MSLSASICKGHGPNVRNGEPRELGAARNSFVRRSVKMAEKAATALKPTPCRIFSRHTWRVLGGAGVTAVSSVAFGPTVAGPLIQMARQGHGARQLAGSISWVSRLATGYLRSVDKFSAALAGFRAAQ